MSTIQETIQQMGRQARAAAYKLAQLSPDEKNTILRAMAAAIREATPELLEANAKDLAAGTEKGLSSAMLDRLRLDEKRIEAMAAGIDQVATLPDPVGQVMEKWTRPNGIEIEQIRVPIGTIGIIYESRPNVTADAAVLCFKTGNATILRGGSEAIHSNVAIAAALAKAGAPEHAIQLIPFTDRESVAVLAGMDQWLDLIIPRGGKGLIETVVSLARMPVIKHYDGICHLFVDKAADLDMAVSLTVNAKTQKCGVCNALETLLVHREIAASFLPKVAAALMAQGVDTERLRGDPPPSDKHRSRHRRRLEHRVSRSHPLHQNRRFARRSRFPHQPLRLPPHRRHRHHRSRRSGNLPPQCGFRLRLPQRLHPLRRRRRIRLRRRDRHLHRQTPRPRPHGVEGTHELSIPGERKRAGKGLRVETSKSTIPESGWFRCSCATCPLESAPPC